MNFFNFKRKHWIIVTVFFFSIVAMVIGFYFFMENLSKKTRSIVRESMIPSVFQGKEEKVSNNPISPSGTLSVETSSCKSCSEKKKDKRDEPATLDKTMKNNGGQK